MFNPSTPADLQLQNLWEQHLRNQIDNLIKKTKEERYTTIDWHTPQTSHEKIELIYKIAKGM